MPENLELLRNLRGAHRGVATKLRWSGRHNEQTVHTSQWRRPYPTAADSRFNDEEASLPFWAEPNDSVSFDDPDNLNDQIVQTEEYDDKICQNIDSVHRFVQRKKHTRHKRAHLQPEAPQFCAILRTSICEVQLALFFRKLLDWISFFDRFKGAVKNNDQLRNLLRLQYLKWAVKGETSKMLTSITVTDDNFDVAMEILYNRYDNKRLILRAHIRWIVSYRPVSNENTRELRKLVNTMEEHRLSIRNMGQPVEHHDPFSVYLIAEKLPTETKFLGAFFKGDRTTDLSGTKDFPGAKVLELAASSNSSSNTRKRSHSQQNQAQNQLHTTLPHDNESAMRTLWRGTRSFLMWEVQWFRCQGASPADQNQRTLFQLSMTRTLSRELRKFFMPPMWTKALHFVASRRYASIQQSSEKIVWKQPNSQSRGTGKGYIWSFKQ